MLKEDLSHFLTCKICSDQLKNPLLLPCNHSFCSSCLEKYISSSKFTCPFCEAEFSNSTKVEFLKADIVTQRMINALQIQQQINSSKIFCSECYEETEAVSYCQFCRKFLCQFHQQNHQVSKALRTHQLVSVSQSMDHFVSSSSVCPLHDQLYEGCCQTCFELCCSHCLFSNHKDSDHVTYPFNEAKESEENETLNYLIRESSKIVDQIKSSIRRIDQVLQNAKERSSSLIKASNKFLFDVFQRILPEIQAEITSELQKNEKILQDQKTRSELHLHLLENELQHAQSSIKSNNIPEIVSTKVKLFHLLSVFFSSSSVPQRLDNINLSCSDYIFNNPKEEFTLADQQLIISSIVNLFSQLFGIKFTIPSLIQIENSLKEKPEILQQQKQRKTQEEERRTNKNQEEKNMKESSIEDLSQKTAYLKNIYSTLKIKYLKVLFQPQIEGWIGKKKWELLYQATSNGFRSSDFHSKCDNKGPTVTIITSKEGYAFGGYTPLSWSSSNSWGNDSSKCTFIFTLTNPYNIPPTKYPLINTSNAIYCYSSYGPTFGSSHDIVVYDQSNQNTNSRTDFPSSYSDTTGKGNITFTGNHNFSTQDIEVYLVSN